MRNPVLPQNRPKTGKSNPVRGSEATRWKQGQSGNPGGRPKLAPLSQAARELLNSPVPNDPAGRTYAELIVWKLAKKALRGDVGAARELADRAEGKSRQAIEVQAQDKIPFDPTEFAGWTRAELDLFAREGIVPARFVDTNSEREN